MTGKRTIYVVDDDDAIRRALEFTLRFRGYGVSLFESGVAFLNVAESLVPDCMLLDIRMPEMDGLEILRRLNEKGLDLPTVVMTGHGDLDVAIEAMAVGAVGFIEKPFEQSTLAGALATAFLKLEDEAGFARYRTESAAAIARLEDDQQRLLWAIAEGRSNEQLADHLGTSTAAIEVRRARLLAALGVATPHDAVRLAFAGGCPADRR